ncbi:hypothetical protein DTO271G3_4361 [Paecilomyces variotii]|nr:hypothetical protein DTO271G3_4361 [Paecilomyces variotii]
MAAKKKVGNARSGRQQPSSRRQAAQGSADMSGSLKDMDASFEERARRHKQALEEHHQSRAQEFELHLHNRVIASRRSMAGRRATRIKRLAELIRRRAEIESLILAHVERLNDSCKLVTGDLQVLVNSAGSHLELP